MNNILLGRSSLLKSGRSATHKLAAYSAATLAALTICSAARAQTAGASSPPPPPVIAAPAPTPAATPGPSAAPPITQGAPQGGPNVPPGLPPGINMPPPPPPPPTEPTAADLKPGLNVTLPATINVSGVAAIVNGQRITNQQLVTEFLKGGGQPMLQELITKTELEQAAAKAHVSVSPAEIDAKIDDSKRQLIEREGNGQTWAQMLASRGLSESFARNQIYIQLLVEKLATAKMPYSLNGQIHVYHLLLATTQLPFGNKPYSDADAKAKVARIAADIASHKLTFQQAAEEYSDDQSNASKGGDLGWVTQNDPLDPTFKAAAFALKEGEVSGPVKSQFGWHLIYVSRFGAHATPAEIEKAKEDTLDQRARIAAQPYIENLQNSAHVENLLIPLPPKPKNQGLGGPNRVPMAPIRANPMPVRPGSTPPSPPL